MEKWTRLLVVLATSLLLLLFVAVAVRLSMGVHDTLLMFALGGLVAYALDPLVGRLSRGRLKRQAAVAIVFVALVAVVGIGAWSLEGRLVKQITALQDDPSYKQRAMTFAGGVDQKLAARHIRFSLVQTIQHPPPDIRDAINKAGLEVLPFVRGVLTDFGKTIIVLLIALYFLIFGSDMREKFNALLPPDLARRADLWETDVSRILGGFVRGQFIIALILGAAAAVGCLLIGIKLWLVIGLIVVVAALIPVFGPYIGLVPAVIAALVGPTHFSSNIVAAIVVIVYFTVINEVASKILYPKLVGAALGLHEVLVLFVLFAGLEINGIVGVLFAAPVAAIAIVSIVHLYRLWQDLPDTLLSNVARTDARRDGHIAPAPQAPEPVTSGESR